MHQLHLSQLSDAQAMAIADGLFEAEEFDLARGVYHFLLPRAPAKLRTRIIVRIGLARGRDNPRLQAQREAYRQLEGEVADLFWGDGLVTWNKSLPFFADDRFVELAERHGRLLPLLNWHWNLSVVLWAVQQAKALDGDLVELGVFKGHTTLFCADYVEFAAWPKRWVLYDTFDGVPDDQLDTGWAEANEANYKGTFSVEEVRERFAHHPNIEVVQGRVPEALAEGCPERIAFLHVDMNNSTAEVAALDALFDRVTPGGAIVFDDFGWAAAHAQRKAETAWFAERGLPPPLLLPTGQGLVIKR